MKPCAHNQQQKVYGTYMHGVVFTSNLNYPPPPLKQNKEATDSVPLIIRRKRKVVHEPLTTVGGPRLTWIWYLSEYAVPVVLSRGGG